MKKKIYIPIALLMLILIFTFISYSIKGPSKTVETYFQNIKSGTSNAITLSMFSSIDSLSSDSDTKKVTDSLINSLSKLDVEVLDEMINGDTATVTVNAKGISLYTTLDQVYDSLKTEEFLKKIGDMTEDELKSSFSSLLLEAITNAQIEERTVDLNLTKVNGKWKIDENEDAFQEVLWGINEKTLAEMGL